MFIGLLQEQLLGVHVLVQITVLDNQNGPVGWAGLEMSHNRLFLEVQQGGS